MAITKALEFDQTANKLLFQVGEEAKQQRALQQKLEQDEARKRAEILNEINPATLYDKFEKEVVSRRLDGLTAAAADYLKKYPNSSLNDFRAFINKDLSSMATQSAKIKAVKDNIKNTFGALGKDSIYDLPSLNALALDRAIYKTDQFNNKDLKDADEIDETQDILASLEKTDLEKIISKTSGNNLFTNIIKAAPLFKKSTLTEVDTPNGRQTVVTGVDSSMPYFMKLDEKNQPVLKKQANGYIEEDIFKELTSSPEMSKYVTAVARDNMKEAGVSMIPENEEIYKRAFVTDFLERNKKGVVELIDKKLYAQAPAAGGSGAEKEPPPTVDLYSEIVSAVDSGKQVRQTQGGKVVQTFGFPLSDITQSAKDIILANVNRAAQFKGSEEDTPRDYTQDDVTLKRKDNNTIGVYEYPSGKFLTDVAKMDVNVKGSGAVGGQKSKVEAAKKAGSESYIIGGKNYTKADLTKLGYTEEQIKQAISLGNIKTK